jgi:hypothetical protein
MAEANKEAKGAKGSETLKTLREMRNAWLDTWAKMTLRLTSSPGYHRLTGAIMKPTLLATAIMRNATEAAMSRFLAQLNMPSREDVLTLAQRLTRMEMTLDDLGANLDQLRRAQARPVRAGARQRESDTRGRSVGAVAAPDAREG